MKLPESVDYFLDFTGGYHLQPWTTLNNLLRHRISGASETALVIRPYFPPCITSLDGVPASAAFTSATFNPINVSLLPFDSIFADHGWSVRLGL